MADNVANNNQPPPSYSPEIDLEEEVPEKTQPSISFSDVPFTFTHGVIAISICIATIVDGFNDNFVVYTHDSLNFTCSDVTLKNGTIFQPEPMKCPEVKGESLECESPTFKDMDTMVPGQSSYISEYGLVCGEKGLIPDLMLSIMFAGVMCATPFNYRN